MVVQFLAGVILGILLLVGWSIEQATLHAESASRATPAPATVSTIPLAQPRQQARHRAPQDFPITAVTP